MLSTHTKATPGFPSLLQRNPFQPLIVQCRAKTFPKVLHLFLIDVGTLSLSLASIYLHKIQKPLPQIFSPLNSMKAPHSFFVSLLEASLLSAALVSFSALPPPPFCPPAPCSWDGYLPPHSWRTSFACWTSYSTGQSPGFSWANTAWLSSCAPSSCSSVGKWRRVRLPGPLCWRTEELFQPSKL